ncbi:MAG: 2-amino-4-hydroxy-6-hydroxymethyldihydropteridine diphosphokinase [Muribaculaceae bacterium]|nr:2-amino-4-hydroxy-6-hydroxymethyldihydropteridine diphosphokinase [Muribaculaceae bacterium]
MIHCILSLGSNDGDREAHLRKALNFLAEICDTLYCSTDYESPALSGGMRVNKPHYLNSVAVVDFDGDTPTLEAMLKACEVMEGRTATARAEGRVPLDMDIVVADGCIIRPKDFRLFFFRRGYEELLPLLGPEYLPKP